MCPRHYVVRVPTMFGPRRNNALGFVDKMLALMRQGRELRIAADKIDSPTYSMDAARRTLELVRANAPYGLYHAVNQGRVSYYDFIVALRDMAGFDNRITAARDADFPALAHKPLRTAMRSDKLEPMRPWQEALSCYLRDEKLID